MAIEKFVAGAVRQVSDAVRDAQPDVQGLRRNLSDQADRSLAALERGGSDHPWLTIADERTIAFSPTTAEGQPLLVNGKTTTFFPRGEIDGAVAAFRAAVDRGDFDGQLTSGGAPTVSPKIEGEQLPADPDNGSMTTGGGRTDGDERETRYTERH